MHNITKEELSRMSVEEIFNKILADLFGEAYDEIPNKNLTDNSLDTLAMAIKKSNESDAKKSRI